MSWQPALDPKPGDTFACDAIDMVIVPRQAVNVSKGHSVGRFSSQNIELVSKQEDFGFQRST